MHIKFYGSRGSIPFSSRDSINYGGNTSCVKIETDERTIIIDCGSGIVQFAREYEQSALKNPLCLDILISHLHIDHIIGLSMFAPLWSKGHNIRIYTKSRNEQPLAHQLFGIFKPPYWPIDLSNMNFAEIIEIKDDVPFSIGDSIVVTPFESNHGDDTSAFRIDSNNSNKSLVYMLDHSTEKNPLKYARDISKCKNADFVIYDSAYLPKDYTERKTWGHSVYSDGIDLAEKSCCKHMIFSHFDQKYTDIELDTLSEEIENLNVNNKYKKYFVAFDGMELRF